MFYKKVFRAVQFQSFWNRFRFLVLGSTLELILHCCFWFFFNSFLLELLWLHAMKPYLLLNFLSIHWLLISYINMYISSCSPEPWHRVVRNKYATAAFRDGDFFPPTESLKQTIWKVCGNESNLSSLLPNDYGINSNFNNWFLIPNTHCPLIPQLIEDSFKILKESNQIY